MGAGANAIFDIFLSIFAAGPGALILIDEIEIGLHEQAQIRLINELKHVSKSQKIQIICTTHSPSILQSLPPEGRVFLERNGSKTAAIHGISAAYACGLLGRAGSEERCLFVEDEIAEEFIQHSQPLEVRERYKTIAIGSAATVARQLASRYLEKNDACIAAFDGDQRQLENDNRDVFLSHIEMRFRESKTEAIQWFQSRISYLPGTSSPEIWLLTQMQTAECIDILKAAWHCEEGAIKKGIEAALLADTHDVLFEISSALSLKKEIVFQDIMRAIEALGNSELENLRAVLKSKLP